MAKAQKYDTIEQVVEATGIELTDKTRPFLESFVKKAGGTGDSASAKKKTLLQEAELFGVQGLDAEIENIATLQIKIITHLFDLGRIDEMNEFAAKHKLFVTESGAIHHIKQPVKAIEQRNAGVKEGSVGYNTIQLLKDPEFANITAAELAVKQAEIFGQETTPACVQWYINFCNKKHAAVLLEKDAAIAAAAERGEELTDDQLLAFDIEAEKFVIAVRKRTTKSKGTSAAGVVLGAELTMEKARQPRGFKKKAPAAELGAPLDPSGETSPEPPGGLEFEGEAGE